MQKMIVTLMAALCLASSAVVAADAMDARGMTHEPMNAMSNTMDAEPMTRDAMGTPRVPEAGNNGAMMMDAHDAGGAMQNGMTDDTGMKKMK